MRSVNVLRNSLYALGSFLLVSVLTIIVRKYFTVYLSVEFLGVEGLFSNIVTMLSLAEMGISSIISYSLYRELANGNKKEINILINIYRYIYSIIGSLVLVFSVIIFFLLKYIVRETTLPWFYIQFIYFIQICTVLSSYFLAYKRTLLVADQKDFICIQVDMICNIGNNILRLLVIILLQDYILYSIIGLLFNIVANLIISNKIKKQYPYIKYIKVTFKEICERRIVNDVKNLLVHKGAGFVYGGADAILVSTMLGLKITGMFANYQLIDRGIFSIMYKALQGIVPSIGSLVYEGDMEKTIRIFWMLDFVYMLFASYLTAVYAILFQPFMYLFFGSNLLLPETLLFVMALNVFTMVQFENMCNFRGTVGMFEKDRNMIVLSAVVKLPVAVLAIYHWGIAGLVFASWLGWFFIGYGRMKIVFNYILKGQSKKHYLVRHFWWSLIELSFVYVLYVGFHNIGYYENYIQLTISGILLVIILTMLNVAVFYRTKEFRYMLEYIKSLLSTFRAR